MTQKKKVVSKGIRLKWSSLKVEKPVKLTSVMTIGKKVSANELVQHSGNTNVLVP